MSHGSVRVPTGFAVWNRNVSAGPLRPWATVLLGIFALIMTMDIVRQHPVDDPRHVPFVLASAAMYVSACIASRWPWGGFLVFIVSGFMVSYFAESGGVLVISCAVMIFVLFVCGSAILMVTAVPTLALWAASASMVLHGDFSLLRAIAVVGVPVGCVGFILGRFRQGIHVAKELNRRLEQENVMIRAREREALARNLHDIVANQLTSIALIAGSRVSSRRSEDLQEALTDVKGLSQEALIELRKLLGLLRTEDAASVEMRQSRADPRDLPSGIESVVARLREFGFAAEVSTCDEDREIASASTVDVLIRILQECCTNALKYALPASVVRIDIRAVGQTVALIFASTMSDHASTPPSDEALSSGQGLKGIRERVRLLGGEVSLGPSGDQWIVDVRLPA